MTPPGPVMRASNLAGLRMASAMGAEGLNPGELRKGVEVTDLYNAFVGTDVPPKEAAQYVELSVNMTFDAHGLDKEAPENQELWRTLAGVTFRALLVGVLAGRDTAGALGVGQRDG